MHFPHTLLNLALSGRCTEATVSLKAGAILIIMDRLPPEFIEHKRTVADMKVGEAAYIAPSALNVDSNGGCWIRRKAALIHEDIVGFVAVRRETNGYHIAIEKQQYTGSHYHWNQNVR